MTAYYINADTGNDITGNGSSGTPWKTLAKFLSSSTTGDTCICQTATASYTWATATVSNRTIQAADPLNPAVFNGGGLGVKWAVSGTVNLQDIKFQNAITSGTRIPFFEIQLPTTLSLSNCRFASLQLDSGFSLGGLIGNSVDTINPGGNITVNLTRCKINNLVGKSGLGAVYLFTGRYTAAAVLNLTFNLTNCIIYTVSTTPSPLNYIFDLYNASNTTKIVSVTNCVIDNRTGGSQSFYNNTQGTWILTNSHTNNITGVPSGTNLTTGDPKFIDPANDNFNLQKDSPLRATGATP